MDTVTPPPPPLLFFVTTTPTTTTTDTSIPQPVTNGIVSNHYHSSSSSHTTASIIIVIIIISSAIIISAGIYFLIRFFSRRNISSFRTTLSSNDVVLTNTNANDHVISITNNELDSLSLPLFTFSSLTGKITGGDCAVCLSKFNGEDQLRLLPLCCHAFHAQCIDSWLKTNLTCPLCRSSVNPTESDIMNKIAADAAGGGGGTGETVGTRSGTRSNSFRIEIGTVSQRRDPVESDRRSYSVGSFEYIIDDGYEIPIESSHRNAVDKDAATVPPPPEQNLAAETGNESGRRNWLREYVDRVSVSLSSRSISFRGGSGRFFTGSSRRSETVVDDYEQTHGRIGEEISELFRWLSGV